MTYGEIYEKVTFLVWGNSAVPAGSQTYLVGDEGLIANTCRKILQDYNYWFMHTHANGDTVADTNSYTLPTEFKEIVEVVFKVEDEDYFKEPLERLNIYDSIGAEWEGLGTTTEYPTKFEIADDAIVFYPTPSGIRTFHFSYFEFFERPSSFADNTNTEYDDLTVYGADAICYLAASEMLIVLDEFNKARVYKQQGMEAIELLKAEDRAKRQNYIKRTRSAAI